MIDNGLDALTARVTPMTDDDIAALMNLANRLSQALYYERLDIDGPPP